MLRNLSYSAVWWKGVDGRPVRSSPLTSPSRLRAVDGVLSLLSLLLLLQPAHRAEGVVAGCCDYCTSCTSNHESIVTVFSAYDGTVSWRPETEYDTAAYFLETSTDPERGPWSRLPLELRPGLGDRQVSVGLAEREFVRLVEREVTGRERAIAYTRVGTRPEVPAPPPPFPSSD